MHPILFKIGPFTLRTYGVFIALAFFVGFFLLYKKAKKINFYPDKILDMELVILIFGIIGSRLLHAAVNPGYYKIHPSEIPMLWRGGLAVYGGIIGGIAAGWVFILRNKMPLFKTGDFFAPYVSLGQSIGRIGCFFNGCCFGKDGYPTQLYAASALFGIFIILKLAERAKHRVGSIFGLYLLLYSTQRFMIDFLRADTPRYTFNLTVSQLISIFVFAAGCVALFIARRHSEGGVAGSTSYKNMT